MKKLSKFVSVVLSLALCLGMAAPAFAASFDDLQAAIDATLTPAAEPAGQESDTPADSGTPAEPVQNTADGSLILDTDNHYGFGWNETDSRFGIEAWDDTDGNRNVELKEDVEHSEDDKASTITVGDGRNVNLDLNGSNIEGDGEHDVIDVKKGGELTVKGDEPAAPEALPRTPGSPLTPPTPSSATYPTTAS